MSFLAVLLTVVAFVGTGPPAGLGFVPSAFASAGGFF